MSNLTVYGCGGAGISALINNKALLESVGATIVAVDSSDSNIDSIKFTNKYQLAGKNGSGGNQLENIDAFRDSIPDILSNYKPSKFNIIVSSTSGGSGSVASMYLAREIVNRGQIAVLILLTTSDSLRRINNTINVIKSLESMSSKIEKPLVMMVHNQCASDSRRSGDTGLYNNLKYMVYLFSNRFEDIDEMDIANLFNYNKVTKVPSQLVTLTAEEITEEFIERTNNSRPPISYINIMSTKYRDDSVVNIPSAYSKTGYFVETSDSMEVTGQPQRGRCYYVDNQSKHDLIARFEKLKTESVEANAASVSKRIDYDETGADDDGFVFDE